MERNHQNWVKETISIYHLGFFIHVKRVFTVTEFKFTLWLFNIAMGNGPFIDGLPI